MKGEAIWLKSSGSGQQAAAAAEALDMLEAADRKFLRDLKDQLKKRREQLEWQREHLKIRRSEFLLALDRQASRMAPMLLRACCVMLLAAAYVCSISQSVGSLS